MEEAFTELGLDQGQNSGVLTAAEAESVLNKMFQLSHRDGDKFTKPELCTELTLNWILKCFDRWGAVCKLVNEYSSGPLSSRTDLYTHSHLVGGLVM